MTEKQAALSPFARDLMAAARERGIEGVGELADRSGVPEPVLREHMEGRPEYLAVEGMLFPVLNALGITQEDKEFMRLLYSYACMPPPAYW